MAALDLEAERRRIEREWQELRPTIARLVAARSRPDHVDTAAYRAEWGAVYQRGRQLARDLKRLAAVGRLMVDARHGPRRSGK
jgi:hypothetical protein